MTRTSAPAARPARAVSLTFLLLAACPVLLSLLLTTDGRLTTLHLFGAGVPLRTICALQFLTGYHCPAWGMTRAFAFMAHGQFAQAWALSPGGALLFGFCIFEAVYRAAWLVFGRMPRALRVLEPALLIGVGAVDLGVFLAQFVR